MKHSSILAALMFLLILGACNNKETTTSDKEDIVKITQEKRQHPARTVEEGMPFKIEAMGGSAKEQIRRQEVANERQLRAGHLNTGGLKWNTFDMIDKMPENKGDKKYLIDVYTEWCGWCKVMDKKTFTDPGIQEYLRENFHIVKFDAERREPVPFNGKKYEFVSGGRRGINTLAIELLGNRMSYPTLVYLDENMNKITASPGYKTPEQLLAELKAISNMKS